MAQPHDPSTSWHHTGHRRPAFAIEPGEGQESVWDYPRPARVEVDTRGVVVRHGATAIAGTHRALRVLETASPPTFYIPVSDVTPGLLVPASGTSWCEWKGEARYWSLVTPDGLLEGVAWSYPAPRSAFAAIRDHVAFYPSRVECYVDGERVRPQPGRFYGGWITHEIVGPFKGEAGTGGW